MGNIDDALKREKSYRQKAQKVVDLYEAKRPEDTPLPLFIPTPESLHRLSTAPDQSRWLHAAFAMPTLSVKLLVKSLPGFSNTSSTPIARIMILSTNLSSPRFSTGLSLIEDLLVFAVKLGKRLLPPNAYTAKLFAGISSSMATPDLEKVLGLASNGI